MGRRHAEFLVPLLDDRGLRATFFVHAAPTADWLSGGKVWQEVAAAGHEIGNQTSRNPCSCAHSDSDPAYCLERLSMQQVWESVEASESVLDELIPIGNGKRSFAYPCYETWVGQGETRLSYVPLVATEFLAARGGPQRITNEPWSVDLSNVRARDVAGRSAPQIIEFIEEGAQKGHWVVLVIRGEDETNLSIEEEVLVEVADNLADNNGRLLAETFSRVASFIGLRRHQWHTSGR